MRGAATLALGGAATHDPATASGAEPTTGAEARPRAYERPKELAGWTWSFALDGHRIYLTVNHDGERVVEVFVSNGPLSPSVGLLASKMLQGGFEPLEVARLLDKVIGTHSIPVAGRICSSPEQVVAEYLRESVRRLRKSVGDAEAPIVS